LFGTTAYRHDTLVELLNYSCYGLFAFVMLQSLPGSDSSKVALGITVFGLAVSVFALLQYFVPNGKLFWIEQVPTDAMFFGPYVNHNHYAGLMEMLLPFPLVFATQTSVSTAKRLFFGLSAIIMGTSLVESGSRGGIIALACQLLLFGIISRFTRIKRGAAIALLVVLVAMGILFAVVADSGVVARITALREPGRADVAGWRMHLNHDSLAMVRAKPVLGWGLGSFATVYPGFRSFYDDAPIREAHNDYMQLLVETGVAGGLIALWFLIVLFREGWRNVSRSISNWDRGITVAAIVAVSGILIHSASDFNLHIPANAAVFFVMCALAAAPMACSQRELRSARPYARHAGTEPLAELEEFPRLRVVARRQ
jgi:O-antigen ligase